MLSILVIVAIISAFSNAQQSVVPKDVDVFNMNYNRNQRNARSHILRSFDVVPTEVSSYCVKNDSLKKNKNLA